MKLTIEQIQNLDFNPDLMSIQDMTLDGVRRLYVVFPDDTCITIGELYALMQMKLDSGGKLEGKFKAIYDIIKQELDVYQKSLN